MEVVFEKIKAYENLFTKFQKMLRYQIIESILILIFNKVSTTTLGANTDINIVFLSTLIVRWNIDNST